MMMTLDGSALATQYWSGRLTEIEGHIVLLC